MKTHYSTLGVSESASLEEIRRAYRDLARQLHPDSTGGDETKCARFKKVAEAYRTLSSETDRRAYDAELDASRTPGERLVELMDEILGREVGEICERVRREGLDRTNIRDVATAFGKAAKITHDRVSQKARGAAVESGGDLFAVVSELLS